MYRISDQHVLRQCYATATSHSRNALAWHFDTYQISTTLLSVVKLSTTQSLPNLDNRARSPTDSAQLYECHFVCSVRA